MADDAEFCRLYTTLGTKGTAEHLGIDERNVRRRRARIERDTGEIMNPPPRQFIRGEAPDGYKVQGTSTLYDADGNLKLEWVKISQDANRQEEMYREAIAGLLEKVKPEKPLKPPAGTSADHMACYPVGDHHIGMLAWHEEAGEDYDTAIAERLLAGAMEYLVTAVRRCDQCVIAFLGDLLHYDNFEPLTPASKNLLDADSRYPKIVRAAIRAIRNLIRLTLKHHAHVKVIVEPGNHDPSSSIFLMELLSALYENEPRVTVDTSPTRFHYFDFGRCLVGTHHGDKRIKPADLPLIMASDRPEEWGRTEYRYIWTGHVHHDTAKDYHGCKVESMRVLAAQDAYATSSGYRSMRDMKAIVLHRDFGEVERHTVNPRMIG